MGIICLPEESGNSAGDMDVLDFQMSPSGFPGGCGRPAWAGSGRSSPSHAPEVPGLDLPIQLSQTRRISSLSLPYPHLVCLSPSFQSLRCPLKLMTFSSQKEVVCGVILGGWVREEPRALRTFPPPHSSCGDMDHSF